LKAAGTCVADDNGLFVNTGQNSNGGDGYARAINPDDPSQLTKLTPKQVIARSYQGRLWAHLADGWIGTATYMDNAALAWEGVAGPGTLLKADGTHVIWARDSYGAPRTERFVARTAVTGKGEQEVVAELTNASSSIDATPSFVVWDESDGTTAVAHVTPFPPISSSADRGSR
jgi:hypothetical protein